MKHYTNYFPRYFTKSYQHIYIQGPMFKHFKYNLARSPFGRVLLHIGCLCQGGKWAWHWQGILREVKRRPFFSFDTPKDLENT